jgi:hypothetical protein
MWKLLKPIWENFTPKGLRIFSPLKTSREQVRYVGQKKEHTSNKHISSFWKESGEENQPRVARTLCVCVCVCFHLEDVALAQYNDPKMLCLIRKWKGLDIHWATRIHKMERRQSGCMQFWLNIWLSQSCKMYVMLGISFSLLYIIKSTHVYEPKFWRFEEKFWTVLADHSQNTRLSTHGIDDLPACYWFFENWNIMYMPLIHIIPRTKKDPLQIGSWICKF